MNAARWAAAAVLAGAVTVAWVLPTVYGPPSVTCINIDRVECERAWRAKASEGGGFPFMPVVKVTVWGNGGCTDGQIDWAFGGGLVWSELCA
jgi:hypothetical protein